MYVAVIILIASVVLYQKMQRKDASSLSYPEPDTREYKGRGVGSRPNPPSDASFLSIVDGRTSVRTFRSDHGVTDHQIHSALRVARLAPSAGNLQAYQVVVVRDDMQKQAIASAAVGQMWIAQAPVVLVFLADPDRSARKYGERGHVLYSVQDATLAASYCQLALEAAGLASCWVGAFHEDLVAEAVISVSSPPPISADEFDRQDLSAVTRLRPVVVMPVGYGAAADDARRPRHHRRAIREFVHQDRISVSPQKNGPSKVKRKRGHKESDE